MATGSARGNSHRCGTIEGKAIVPGRKARQNVLSDAPNETEIRDRWRRRVLHTWRTPSKNQGYSTKRPAVRSSVWLGVRGWTGTKDMMAGRAPPTVARKQQREIKHE